MYHLNHNMMPSMGPAGSSSVQQMHDMP